MTASRSEVSRAVEAFRSAIAIDPDYAAAWTRRFGIATPRLHCAIRRSSISPLHRNGTAYAPMDALVNGADYLYASASCQHNGEESRSFSSAHRRAERS